MFSLLIADKDHGVFVEGGVPGDARALLVEELDFPGGTLLPVVQILRGLRRIELYSPLCAGHSQDETEELGSKLDVSYLLVGVVAYPDVFPCCLGVDYIALVALISSLHLIIVDLLLFLEHNNLLVVPTGRYDASELRISPLHPKNRTFMLILNLVSADPLILAQNGICFLLDLVSFGKVRVGDLGEVYVCGAFPYLDLLVARASSNPFAIVIKLDIVHKILMLQREREQSLRVEVRLVGP